MDVQTTPSISPRQFATPATVAVRPLLLKPQRMNGLSERLLVSHYENNYGGALRRLDEITPAGMTARLDVTLTDEPPIAQTHAEPKIAVASAWPPSAQNAEYQKIQVSA